MRAALAVGVAVAVDAGDVVALRCRSRRSAAGPRCAGTSCRTSPSSNWRPTPPSPVAPWQLAQLLYTSAPTPSGPVATSGGSVSARTYMNSHSGIRLSAAIAQNGIFLRRLAAATYGGSGFGGGAGAGAAAALRAAGPLGGGGARPVRRRRWWPAPAAGASAAAGRRRRRHPSPRAARRSRERFSRCSGISVTRRHDRRPPHAASGKQATVGSESPATRRHADVRGGTTGCHGARAHLCTTCAEPEHWRARLHFEPDVRCDYGSCKRSRAASHHRTDGRRAAIRTPDRHQTTNENGKATASAMLAIDILKWPGVNVAVPGVVHRRRSLLTLAVIPYGKRRPVGKPIVVGRGDARRRSTPSA